MSTPEPSSEPASVLEALRRQIERGNELSRKPTISRIHLQLWAMPVRAQLGKIYGKDAPQLANIPNVPGNLREDAVLPELNRRLEQLRYIVESLDSLLTTGTRVFIGHGRSSLWRELKDFIAERLKLNWDEFNREAVAGYTTSERLDQMLSQAAFAFLILTAEEEGADGTVHARSNVIHEVGLFQGRLGVRRAIVLLEDGCTEFSNITGLVQIRFPRGDIAARFEEIRRVLEREGLV
ncbi:MAG TPA: TIR domain-containing protein [Burkholderiales bacterium]|nr:TIR domain-containing protein [Burkholderiales bacterium]